MRRLAGQTFGPSACSRDALDGPPCERDEQRNERDPRDCRMTVFRETQREQDARGQG